jgi:hypothetical protein
MIFGYARVSTDAQDLTAQLKDLKAAGCERVFKEKVTGATADRPQLKKLMATVEHGDVVIIAAVDRLSRDTTDLMVIASDLQRAGAGLRSLAEPVVDSLMPRCGRRTSASSRRDPPGFVGGGDDTAKRCGNGHSVQLRQHRIGGCALTVSRDDNRNLFDRAASFGRLAASLA